jgi:predicted RNase H-like HicB family nuclease
MDITLLLHLDWNDEGEATWWAEAPEISGFTASADTLHELRDALPDCFADLAEDVGPIHIAHEVLADGEDGIRPSISIAGEHAPESLGGLSTLVRIPAFA